WTESWQQSLETEASNRIEEAVAWAESVPEPEPDDMFKRMFAEPTPNLVEQEREATGRGCAEHRTSHQLGTGHRAVIRRPRPHPGGGRGPGRRCLPRHRRSPEQVWRGAGGRHPSGRVRDHRSRLRARRRRYETRGRDPVPRLLVS